MGSLDKIRPRLQPIEQESNHREFAYDVMDWVDYCNKQYGCIEVACSEVHLLLDNERSIANPCFIQFLLR